MYLKSKCQRCFLYICCYNKYNFIVVFLFLFIVLCFSHLGEVLNNILPADNDAKYNGGYYGEPIDIIYTWVNGSDPVFKQNLKVSLGNNDYESVDFSDERFDDKYELKFSLRSLEKYAPWVNHVYIVTNGQIPYWLNLDYEKVTVISHDEIFEDKDNLPTFSSPAIESNIHRIPGLSKHFIYFNDDIFLGAPIFPDDFLSPSRGYLVYLAWPLPSCMPNCPWIYVGDGQCDSSCFYEQCQYDGGDCTNDYDSSKKRHHFGAHHEDTNDIDDDLKSAIDYEYFEEDKKHHLEKRDLNIRAISELINIHNNSNNRKDNNSSGTTIISKSNINNSNSNNNNSNSFKSSNSSATGVNVNKPISAGTLLGSITIQTDGDNNGGNKAIKPNQVLMDLLRRNREANSFKSALKNHDSVHSKMNRVPQLVEEHNKKILLNDKLNRKKRLYRTIHHRKKYYNRIFNNMTGSDNAAANRTLDSSGYRIDNKPLKQKENLDTFALSLQHTHRIFNIAYGFKARKVPAHAPILIDKDIMISLQKKFRKEFEKTQKNRLRSQNDMQYSFSYYYFLMNEKIRNNVSDIFDSFDTDNSGTWSDREIRTILTRINDLPLNYGMVELFDTTIINCSKNIKTPADVTVPPYERYLDSKLPLVTKKLVLNCPPLLDVLNDNFGIKTKYNFEVIKNAQSQFVMFKMLTSNVSDVVGHLDEIRKQPRKFVCLNDNMSSKKSDENDLVKSILLDFYLSMFPKPSQFELHPEYRNRFTYIQDLKEWKTYHIKLKLFLLFCIVILSFVIIYNVCKRRLLRQIKRVIYF